MEPIITDGAREAAAALAAVSGVDRHDVAVVLGSGWAAGIDGIGDTIADLATTELPGFAPPAVEGHAGRVRSLRIADRNVLAFLGRTHYYEARDPTAVAHGVRTAAAAGCSTVVLTNACGGMNPAYQPGQIVVIADHINLTAASPLRGGQFVDLTDLYAARLRALCHELVSGLAEGIYVGYWGPNYETPAEIRAFRGLGGDLVGMSTVLEAIAARAAGLEVLGLSLVTNLAAGMAGPLSHEEVLATGQAAEAAAGALLRGLLERLPLPPVTPAAPAG
jgi:purine-nucleoside phosphorylase